MGKAEEAGVAVDVPFDDVDLHTKGVFGEEALRATEIEHSMTFFEGVRLYPAAVGWSAFFSLGIIMTAFDPQLLGSLYAESAFQKDFGYLFEGKYVSSFCHAPPVYVSSLMCVLPADHQRSMADRSWYGKSYRSSRRCSTCWISNGVVGTQKNVCSLRISHCLFCLHAIFHALNRGSSRRRTYWRFNSWNIHYYSTDLRLRGLSYGISRTPHCLYQSLFCNRTTAGEWSHSRNIQTEQSLGLQCPFRAPMALAHYHLGWNAFCTRIAMVAHPTRQA